MTDERPDMADYTRDELRDDLTVEKLVDDITALRTALLATGERLITIDMAIALLDQLIGRRWEWHA